MCVTHTNFLLLMHVKECFACMQQYQINFTFNLLVPVTMNKLTRTSKGENGGPLIIAS